MSSECIKSYKWENMIFTPLTLKGTGRARHTNTGTVSTSKCKQAATQCRKAETFAYYLRIKGRDEHLSYSILANI